MLTEHAGNLEALQHTTLRITVFDAYCQSSIFGRGSHITQKPKSSSAPRLRYRVAMLDFDHETLSQRLFYNMERSLRYKYILFIIHVALGPSLVQSEEMVLCVN